MAKEVGSRRPINKQTNKTTLGRTSNECEQDESHDRDSTETDGGRELDSVHKRRIQGGDSHRERQRRRVECTECGLSLSLVRHR